MKSKSVSRTQHLSSGGHDPGAGQLTKMSRNIPQYTTGVVTIKEDEEPEDTKSYDVRPKLELYWYARQRRLRLVWFDTFIK